MGKCLDPPPTHTHTPSVLSGRGAFWPILSLILFHLFMLSASILLKGKNIFTITFVLQFSVGIGGFVIGLCQISFFFLFKEIRELGTLTLYFTLGFNFRKGYTFSYVNVVWNCTVVQHWFSFLFISFFVEHSVSTSKKTGRCALTINCFIFWTKSENDLNAFQRSSTILTNQWNLNSIHESWITNYHIWWIRMIQNMYVSDPLTDPNFLPRPRTSSRKLFKYPIFAFQCSCWMVYIFTNTSLMSYLKCRNAF